MIVVTGAAGFIASALVSRLNQDNFNHLVVADDFSRADREPNLAGKRILERVDRENLEAWLEANGEEVEFIFHLGARTDTTEFDVGIHTRLNLEYSKMIWRACVKFQIPLVYASSAATYGLGELGYEDNHQVPFQLQPLNPYGVSKNEFDKWALQQEEKPWFWAGLKFFNVYGPNEYHKGRMASVILHAFRQIGQTGAMKLFRSHHPDYRDGEQMRDFVYVKDLLEVMLFLMHDRKPVHSGLYNMGTGEARTFIDLVRATFKALGKTEDISFVDTPIDIRDKYQYFTEANMSKLRAAGYDKPFTSLEDGVADYVKHYLVPNSYY